MQRDVGKFGISDKRGRKISKPDPFLPRDIHKEPSLCGTCHTVFFRKNWTRDSEIYRELQSIPKVHQVTCPACVKIKCWRPGGDPDHARELFRGPRKRDPQYAVKPRGAGLQ